MKPSIRHNLVLAFERATVIRALTIAAIVGSVLVLINHGMCIFSGQFGFTCLVQSVLNFLSIANIVLRQRTNFETGLEIDCRGSCLETILRIVQFRMQTPPGMHSDSCIFCNRRRANSKPPMNANFRSGILLAFIRVQ